MLTRPITDPVVRPLVAAVYEAARGFGTQSLFASGEQGVHYSPSDLSTLYQDLDGNIPVTADGQTVALMLDKSRGTRGVINLLTWSEAFDNSSVWALGPSTQTIQANAAMAPDGTMTADKLVEHSGFLYSRVEQTISKEASAIQYVATYYAKAAERTQAKVGLAEGNNGAQAFFNLATGQVIWSEGYGLSPFTDVSARITPANNGFYRLELVATTNTAASVSSQVDVAVNGTNTYNGDGVSGIYIWGGQLEKGSSATSYQRNDAMRGGLGNHAMQSDPARRPIYRRGDSRGAVNLLKWSQGFNEAAWVLGPSSQHVVANAALAPDGTMTADKFVEHSGASYSRIEQNTTSSGASVVYVVTCYVKPAERSHIKLAVLDGSGSGAQAYFDAASGAVLSAGGTGPSHYTNIAASASPADNGYYRLQLKATCSTNNPVRANMDIAVDGFNSYTGDGTSGIYIWGMQLERGSVATDYQRNDDHLGGVATGLETDLRWLETDGANHGMYTNAIDFTSTNKLIFLLGIRRFNNAFSVIAEFSEEAAANNGSFAIASNYNGTVYDVAVGSRGTQYAEQNAAYVAPPSASVIGGILDISAPLIRIRRNGASVAEIANSQGTGNYGNHKLYLFSRNSNLPFPGWFHGMLLVGRLATEVETAAAERYLAAKVGVVL